MSLNYDILGYSSILRGSILLRALKSKIIFLLTYVHTYIRNNGHLINMGKFYFEDVQF
jgi:hypothetical protein